MKKSTKIILILTILLYTILYPKFMTISDETNYLVQGELIKDGKLWNLDPSESYHHQAYNNHYVSKYSPIVPILLTLPLLINWKLIFLINITLHIIGFFIFKKILKRLDIDERYSILYLIFPSFIFFSRTIMSETGTTVSILLAFYLYISKNPKDHIAAGFFFGIACLFRYPALIFALPFFTISFFKDIKKFTRLCIGIIPIATIIGIYNYFVFGGILTSGFNSGSPTQNNTLNYIFNVIKTYGNYIITLSVIYPLMLISMLFYRKNYRLEIISTITFSILIFGFANNSIFRFSFLENTIFSIRYILPIIPLLIICYSDFLDNILRRLRLKKLLPIIFMFIFIISAIVSYKHYELSSDSEKIMEAIYENIPENSLITGDVFSMRYISPTFGLQKGMYLTNTYLEKESKNRETYVIAVKEQRWIQTCENNKLKNPNINCKLEEINTDLKTKLTKIINLNKNTIYIFKVIQEPYLIRH